ncbi:L-type lectin-domain containing receptor kinase IX.2-like [Hevea brasiliensis]|uniref:L-type lectin-domain containing receptor kinase IX.2-like n=1 Tax=Hevea brasiliensis TaxID=3981 RepID=UPI0025CF69CF|nr:L-type lectin-domain containing receptor kinase IX.2-like [Hevea brasiliensis]
MVFSNCKTFSLLLKLQTSFQVLMIAIFLSQTNLLAAGLSFNFTSFNVGDLNISYERAFPAEQAIQLTNNMMGANEKTNFGRATYCKSMQLWDEASGNLTDFQTHFSFVIDSKSKFQYGDGLTFFLAPEGSKLPPNVTEGCTLGLTFDGQQLNTTVNSFVAVEFDIFSNDFDPSGEHEMQYLSVILDLRDYLPELVTFGFSAATGSLYAMHRVYSWDFSSTLEIDENITIPTQPTEAPSPISYSNPKENADDEEGGHFLDEFMDDEFQKGTGPRRFSYRELARATNNFKDEEKLGEGGFGGVYKGYLKDTNSYVAVKRISRGSKQGVKEYAAEVKIISRLRHRNLVQLIGWCHERKDLSLVYEFMPNGSLDSHLFREKRLLTWEVRFRIAKGIASGLLYLHEEWEQCVVHRDIKSSNIMLDSNFNAKLGDFGLARMMEHGKGLQTTVLAGTMGYMAPECLRTGKASRESDVYSFGVVALEIACGRRPINSMANEEEVHMVSWVWELYGRGKLLEAADPRLCGDFDKQEMKRLMIVGLWCAHPDKSLRPSISQSIHVLNLATSLPSLPLQMPVPTYLNTLVKLSSFSLSCDPDITEGHQNQSSTNNYKTNSS